MTRRKVALDDLRHRSREDVLREVVTQQEELTVQLPEGGGITIRPAVKPDGATRLKPLPLLDGFVPEGWKDAVYE
jgi:hypothetical protein